MPEGPPPPLEGVLTELFSRSSPGNRILITCPYTRILRVDMAILRVCLDIRREKGIYISIDRPHGFVQSGLRKMGVPLEGLMFIDAISKLTGTRAEGAMVRFLTSVYSIPILDDLFSRAYLPEGRQTHFVRLEEMGFLLVDNITVMLQYATMEKVRRLVTGLTDMVRKFTDMRSIIVLDPGASPELYKLIRASCDRELPVQEGGV
ncbi:MAG: hypothetical protein ACUVV6_01270 [Thermoplasmatota archaeon]